MSWLPDWLTGYDAENAKRAEDADAWHRARNAEIYEPGSQAARDSAANYEWQGPINEGSQRDDIQGEFNAGLADGANNVIGKPLNFLGGLSFSTVGAALKAIPGWLWIIGILAVVIYFGGTGWLVRKAKSVLP